MNLWSSRERHHGVCGIRFRAVPAAVYPVGAAHSATPRPCRRYRQHWVKSKDGGTGDLAVHCCLPIGTIRIAAPACKVRTARRLCRERHHRSGVVEMSTGRSAIDAFGLARYGAAARAGYRDSESGVRGPEPGISYGIEFKSPDVADIVCIIVPVGVPGPATLVSVQGHISSPGIRVELRETAAVGVGPVNRRARRQDRMSREDRRSRQGGSMRSSALKVSSGLEVADEHPLADPIRLKPPEEMPAPSTGTIGRAAPGFRSLLPDRMRVADCHRRTADRDEPAAVADAVWIRVGRVVGHRHICRKYDGPDGCQCDARRC